MTSTNSNSLLNPPQSAFEKLDFNKSDWSNLCSSMKSIDCSVFYSDKPIDVCIDELIKDIGIKCSIHVPLKRPKKPHISKFHRERKILMRRRSKLCKKTIPCPKSLKSSLILKQQSALATMMKNYLMSHGR